MTGFGEASLQQDGVHFFLEVRSINNKYFKAVLRLPDDLEGLEPELEAELRRRLTRGTVTLVGKTTDPSASAAFTINDQALARYMEQLLRTPQVKSGEVKIDAGAMLTLPGVLQPPADEEQRFERAHAAFMKLLEKACADLIAMREREGGLLTQELMSQHDIIVERLQRVAERAPAVVQEYHTRLRARIEAMLKDAGATIEPGDLIREVAVYAERSDIAEETQRLASHMRQFRELLTSEGRGPVGRTLDFLAQEMLREANTIASKSGDAAISRDIVEIKGAIDRIKEQVQNVE
jgi:uncharacterized protein (TIGR00255 family)